VLNGVKPAFRYCAERSEARVCVLAVSRCHPAQSPGTVRGSVRFAHNVRQWMNALLV